MKDGSLALSLCGLTFMMTVIWGGPLLRILRHFRIGKLIRVEGPARHFAKMGTPTMGGVLFIVPVALVTVMMNAASLVGISVLGEDAFFPVIVMIAFAVLGAIDDWEGIRGPRRGLGMRARTKFLYQIILGAGVAFVLRDVMHAPQLIWPGYNLAFDLGFWYLPLATVIVVGMANAVNFTDGLDGLAGLISVTAFASYGAIALMSGEQFLARFCFTVVGALFGFLWFNVHPAEMIMGDTGSMALGSALGVVALMSGKWLFLPLLAIIPVSELLSVVLQVGYFKMTKGRRLFKMAPLHHHFELLGWSETQVVQRFWLVSLVVGILGIAMALV